MESDEYNANWIQEDILDYPSNESFSVVGPRYSACISVLCSSLIINVILRSSTRMNSIYHRIIMGMSVNDILGSAAIAFTTLPFPKDDKWVNMYNYDGTRLGTYVTCNAQGFFQFFGLLGAYLYNMMLCVYYAFSLALSIKDETITRFGEVWIHLIPASVSISIATKILVMKGYNPAPRRTSWCTMTPLPYSCIDQPSPPPCERGSLESHKQMEKIFLIISSIKMMVIIISLSMVCLKVTSLYCGIRRTRNGGERLTEQQTVNRVTHFRVVRATFIQAISYISALIITVLPPLILLGAPNLGKRVIGKVYVIFLPLQGMFNFIIFVGAKVYHLRRNGVTFMDALREILCEPSFEDNAEAIVFTGMQTAIERDADVQSSSSESKPPSCYDDFNEEGLTPPSTNESVGLGPNISLGSGWDSGISFKSRSTANNSGGISDISSRGSLPAGLSVARSDSSAANNSGGTSELGSHSSNFSAALSHDLSLSTQK